MFFLRIACMIPNPKAQETKAMRAYCWYSIPQWRTDYKQFFQKVRSFFAHYRPSSRRSRLGLFASLTGHENTARRAQKTAEVVSQDISVSNLVYKDGKFSAVEEAADKAKNALSALLVESLNSVFAAGGK